jgi:hypothetical protein
MENQQEKDQLLWQTAKARVAFKKNLISYLSVNILLWIIWFLTSFKNDRSGIPWPIWSTIFGELTLYQNISKHIMLILIQ